MTRTSLLLIFATSIIISCAASIGDPSDDDSTEDPVPEQPVTPPADSESCDGLDDDFDGQVDEGCTCSDGDNQPCYGGLPEHAGVGVCAYGEQACSGDSEFGSWGSCDGFGLPSVEDCDDGVDNDCNGLVDDCDTQNPPSDPDDPDAPVEVPLFLIGDCVTAACPAAHPYPVGCNVLFSPGDDRGCVASEPDESVVYFQAGDECDKGLIVGTLLCSATMGPPLSAGSCPINKPLSLYPDSPAGCPEIQD